MNETSLRTLETSSIVILITALVYVGGWSYAYHWYNQFEMGLIGLGIPSEYQFIYGYWVLRDYWWLVLPFALTLAVALIFWTRSGPILVLAAPIWLPLAFLLVYSLGETTAETHYRKHRESGFQHYPWVRVWTIPDSDTPPDKLQGVHRDLAAGKYRLLSQTDQSIYLIQPKKDGSGIPTLQIPRKQIRALRRISTNQKY